MLFSLEHIGYATTLAHGVSSVKELRVLVRYIYASIRRCPLGGPL